MGWAARHIEELNKGSVIQFRPKGQSMAGKIDSGQLVTVEPLGQADPKPGEIVLCKVSGREYLHLVKAVRGAQFQIGNNKGGINGWVSRSSIFGTCVHIED
jgi:hypothetical protein